MSNSRSIPRRMADPQYCTFFQWSLCGDNGNLVPALVVVDRNLCLWISLTAAKSCVRKYHKITYLISVRKTKFHDILIKSMTKMREFL